MDRKIDQSWITKSRRGYKMEKICLKDGAQRENRWKERWGIYEVTIERWSKYGVKMERIMDRSWRDEVGVERRWRKDGKKMPKRWRNDATKMKKILTKGG